MAPPSATENDLETGTYCSTDGSALAVRRASGSPTEPKMRSRWSMDGSSASLTNRHENQRRSLFRPRTGRTPAEGLLSSSSQVADELVDEVLTTSRTVHRGVRSAAGPVGI